MLLNKNAVKFLITYEKHLILNRFVASLTNLKKENLSNNRDQEWEKALPFTSIPGPSKLKLMKNFLPFGKYYKKPRTEFTKLLHEEYGDLIRMPMLGNSDILFLFDPKYFEKIYRTEGKWPGRLSLPTMLHYRTVKDPETFAAGNLITEQGERWGKFRSIVNPVIMQPKTIRIYVPRLEKISCQFVNRIRKIRDEKTNEVPGTFEKELNKWALESVCVIALDKHLGLLDDNNINSDAINLLHSLQEIFKSNVDMGINPSFFKYIETSEFKKVMNAYATLTTISKKYITEAIENYKLINKNLENNDIEKSIVERLISVNKDVAVILALEMFFAGVDTTTSAITGCLLSLAKNPEKQQILRCELKKFLPEKNSKITEEILKNFSYLRAVIKESIRMYPVVEENARKAGDNIVIKNYQIPKGIDILMLNSILYKNDKYFSQSDKFIPKRWIRNKDKINENSDCPIAGKPTNPFVYLPFGFGTRMCIGKRIVEMELELALANIIRNFHIEFNYPEDDVFSSFIINTPAKELKFKFIDIE